MKGRFMGDLVENLEWERFLKRLVNIGVLKKKTLFLVDLKRGITE